MNLLTMRFLPFKADKGIKGYKLRKWTNTYKYGGKKSDISNAISGIEENTASALNNSIFIAIAHLEATAYDVYMFRPLQTSHLKHGIQPTALTKIREKL